MKTPAKVAIGNWANFIVVVRKIVQPEIKGSHKLSRAVDELESIETYLRDIADALPPNNQPPVGALASKIGFRLIGCAGLLALACSDIALRIRRRKHLQQSATELARTQGWILALGREFSAGARDDVTKASLLFAADRAAELAKVLEDHEAHMSMLKKAGR